MERDFTQLWAELKNVPFNTYSDFEKTIFIISNFFSNKTVIEKGDHPHPDFLILHKKIEDPSLSIEVLPIKEGEWKDSGLINLNGVLYDKYRSHERYRLKTSESIFEYQYYIYPCFPKNTEYPKLSEFLTDDEFEKMPKAKGLNYVKIDESKKERVAVSLNTSSSEL